MEKIVLTYLVYLSSAELKTIIISDYEIYYDTGVVNKDQAESICSRKGYALPNTIGLEEKKTVEKLMLSWNIDKLWLGISYSHDEEWRWSGSFHKKKTRKDILRTLPGLDCVVVRHLEYFAKNCFSIADGYLCERKDCSYCSRPSCVTADGTCASVVSRNVTWYNGMAECVNTGGQLAGISTMMSKELRSMNKEYWIGLFRNGWFASAKQKSNRLITENRWQNDIDMKKGEYCAIITQSMAVDGSDSKSVWKPVKCDEKYQFACLYRKPLNEDEAGTSYSTIPTVLPDDTLPTFTDRNEFTANTVLGAQLPVLAYVGIGLASVMLGTVMLCLLYVKLYPSVENTGFSHDPEYEDERYGTGNSPVCSIYTDIEWQNSTPPGLSRMPIRSPNERCNASRFSFDLTPHGSLRSLQSNNKEVLDEFCREATCSERKDLDQSHLSWKEPSNHVCYSTHPTEPQVYVDAQYPIYTVTSSS